MSGLELAALAGIAVWLIVLSVVTLLVTRQISLITVRLSLLAPHSPAEDSGPEIGATIDPHAQEMLGGRDGVILLLSATCGTCRSLASLLSADDLSPSTVVLVSGTPRLAAGVAELIRPQVDLRFDPDATALANALNLEMVPFGIRVDSGVVSMKGYIQTPHDVMRLHRTGAAIRSAGELQVTTQNGHNQKDGVLS